MPVFFELIIKKTMKINGAKYDLNGKQMMNNFIFDSNTRKHL